VLQQDRTLQRNQLAYFGFASQRAGCRTSAGSGLEYRSAPRLASARGDASRQTPSKIEQTPWFDSLIVGQPDEEHRVQVLCTQRLSDTRSSARKQLRCHVRGRRTQE
jgi:hypothetical protein